MLSSDVEELSSKLDILNEESDIGSFLVFTYIVNPDITDPNNDVYAIYKPIKVFNNSITATEFAKRMSARSRLPVYVSNFEAFSPLSAKLGPNGVSYFISNLDSVNDIVESINEAEKRSEIIRNVRSNSSSNVIHELSKILYEIDSRKSYDSDLKIRCKNIIQSLDLDITDLQNQIEDYLFDIDEHKLHVNVNEALLSLID